MRSPEERLIVLLAHRIVDGEAVGEAVGDVRDWNRVIDLAARHGLLPLMAAHLAGMPVPQPVARNLVIGQIQTRQWNETTVREMIRFAEALQARGVAYAIYKGAVVAQRCYGDMSLRDYSDFDVLVSRDSLPAVDEAIRAFGYSLLVYRQSHEQERNRREGCEEPWAAGSGACLDLHWAVTDVFFPIGLSTTELLARSIAVSVGGTCVRTLCDEDHLIVLSTHAAKHRFQRLEWLTLVGEWMTRPDLSWDLIAERAMRSGCATSLAIACALAARVLGYPLPESVGALPVRRRDVDRLVDVFDRDMFVDRDVTGQVLVSWRTAFRLFDRRIDGVRASALRIFRPQPADEWAMPLPSGCRWMYYFTRPFRLAGKYVRRLFTSSG